MKRLGATIGLKKECLEEYKRIHVKLWPEIEGAIKEAGISNYSIYYVDGQLFGYFEYTGPDHEFAERMKRLAAAPRMREWWNVTEPLQVPRPDRAPGDWWTSMEEVFHLD
jgi:L-rhamnose mutarotase